MERVVLALAVRQKTKRRERLQHPELETPPGEQRGFRRNGCELSPLRHSYRLQHRWIQRLAVRSSELQPWAQPSPYHQPWDVEMNCLVALQSVQDLRPRFP